MFFTCLNALAAIWLFTTPMFWPELPARGVLAMIVGTAAIVLGIFSVVSRGARIGLVVVGGALAVVNFFLPGDIDVLASHVTSALVIMACGLSPIPHVVVKAASVATPAVQEKTGPASWSERAAA
jgi:hypothetical protein